MNIRHAIVQGHVDMIERLLAANAPIDPLNETRCTPLHLAAQLGQSDCIRVLLGAGADAQAKNADELAALDMAIIAQNRDAIEALCECEHVAT